MTLSEGSASSVKAPERPCGSTDLLVDTIDVGGGLIYGMAAVEGLLYVLTGSGAVGSNGVITVVDTATHAVRNAIEAGPTPFDIVIGNDVLYVSNVDDGTVLVVDPVAGTVSDVIDVGADPLGLAVCGERLYVARGTGTVSVIDLATNTEIAQITIADDPFGLAAAGDRLYVTNYGGHTVSVIDTTTNGVFQDADAPRDAGRSAYFAAVTGGRLYVANSAIESLTVIDGAISAVVDLPPASSAIESIPAGAAPVDVVVCSDRLYVGNLGNGTVEVLDADTNQVVESIRSGIQPGLMTASADGRTVYVADVMGGTVRVITGGPGSAGPGSPCGPRDAP